MAKPKRKKITLPRSVHRLFPQVKTAYDATDAIEVSVRPKDCQDAETLNPMECALARAAKREHKATGAIIGMATSYIIKGTTAIRYQTPQSVQREIVSFDRHGDFSPGEYYLYPKPQGARLGAEWRRPPRPSGPKTQKRKVHKSARVRVLPTGMGE